MDYEDELRCFLTKHSHFIGVYPLEAIYSLTNRILEGSDHASTTTLFEVSSPYVTKTYYALLYRSNSRHIEWFDPLGMTPPENPIDWCSDYGFVYPEYCAKPLLSPDKITWSGEFCAYFMKNRLEAPNMIHTYWRYFMCSVPSNITRVRRAVDFSPKWGPPFPNWGLV